jgi:glycosyltransferase involved in cell wall biosynthesis
MQPVRQGGQVVINGRFFSRPVTGVERYAREMVGALDKLLADDSSAWPFSSPPVLVAPKGVTCDMNLQRISFENTRSALVGHLWEQTQLASRAHGNVLVSLCNAGPVLCKSQLVVLHDAAVFRYPNDFRRSYRIVHRLLGRVLAGRCRLATVSNFARRELSSVLGLPETKIAVIPNGGDHLNDIAVQEPSSGMPDKPYFLVVGSAGERKNLSVLVRALSHLPPGASDVLVVGASRDAVFQEANREHPLEVRWTGRLADGELRALYAKAIALIYPSRYEGFGLPPLEAFANKCMVLAADSGAVRETCGDAALYFDPDNDEQLAALMIDSLANRFDRGARMRAGRERLDSYTWASAARQLCLALSQIHPASSRQVDASILQPAG